jgi:hypothetical protein
MYIRNSSMRLAYVSLKWETFTSEVVYAVVVFWASYMWPMGREKRIDAATLVVCLENMRTVDGCIVKTSSKMYNDMCENVHVKSVLKCIRKPTYDDESWKEPETVKFMQEFPMFDVMKYYIPGLCEMMAKNRASAAAEYEKGCAAGVKAAEEAKKEAVKDAAATAAKKAANAAGGAAGGAGGRW